MKLRQGSAIVIFVICLAAIAIFGLIIYALLPPRNNGVSKQDLQVDTMPKSPRSGFKRVEIQKLSFELPDAWQGSTLSLNDAIKEYTFSDSNSGDFLKIRVGGGGSSIGSDATWRYATRKGSSGQVTLLQEEEDCNTQQNNPFCEAGDGKLNIYVSIDSGGQVGVIDGQLYTIFIGNSKSETTNRQKYRDILATGYVEKSK